VECQYRKTGERSFGFVVPHREPDLALVIDPGLEWSTFLGGSDWDEGRTVAVDDAGVVTVGGYVYSSSFPVTLGAFDTTYNGGNDAFVARLNAQGSALIFATYLGGSAEDVAFSLAVDSSGETVVVGGTQSSTS
jgi:hypothetical protein